MQKRLKSNGYLLKEILVSFYVAHDPSCPFTRLEIKPEDLFRSGLSVVAKEKTGCVILFSFHFTILEGGLLCACVAVEESYGPLEISMWTALCHYLSREPIPDFCVSDAN